MPFDRDDLYFKTISHHPFWNIVLFMYNIYINFATNGYKWMFKSRFDAVSHLLVTFSRTIQIQPQNRQTFHRQYHAATHTRPGSPEWKRSCRRRWAFTTSTREMFEKKDGMHFFSDDFELISDFFSDEFELKKSWVTSWLQAVSSKIARSGMSTAERSGRAGIGFWLACDSKRPYKSNSLSRCRFLWVIFFFLLRQLVFAVEPKSQKMSVGGRICFTWSWSRPTRHPWTFCAWRYTWPALSFTHLGGQCHKCRTKSVLHVTPASFQNVSNIC